MSNSVMKQKTITLLITFSMMQAMAGNSWDGVDLTPYSPFVHDSRTFKSQYPTFSHSQEYVATQPNGGTQNQVISFPAYAKSVNYDALSQIERVNAWQKYRDEILPRVAEKTRYRLDHLQNRFEELFPRPTVNLGPVDRWRYDSCLDEAVKAPTEAGVIQGSKNCRERFGQ